MRVPRKHKTQPAPIGEYLVSNYYMPGTLLRTIHKTGEDEVAGWGQKWDQTTVEVGGTSIQTTRSWDCGPEPEPPSHPSQRIRGR